MMPMAISASHSSTPVPCPPTVDHTAAAQEREALTRLFPYDVLILDVTLPEGADAGRTLSRTLRAAGYDAPVLFLTARGETDDLVSGFEAGGDEFGERQQIALLPFTGLTRRGNPAVESGALTHVNPPDSSPDKPRVSEGQQMSRSKWLSEGTR
jgi:CheY-like chemotaxis protein